jgi:hypothetical protein
MANRFNFFPEQHGSEKLFSRVPIKANWGQFMDVSIKAILMANTAKAALMVTRVHLNRASFLATVLVAFAWHEYVDPNDLEKCSLCAQSAS